MANGLVFIVIPFSADKKGRLRPGSPKNLKDRDMALLAAGRMSVYSAGVIVIAQEVDAAADVYCEPRLVAHFGEIPEGMIEELAA